MVYSILALAVYIVGILTAYRKMKDWKHSKYEKVAFSVIWPLVAVLYGIHWLHNREW